MGISKADLAAIIAGVLAASPQATAAPASKPAKVTKRKRAKVDDGDPAAQYSVSAGDKPDTVHLTFTAKPTGAVRDGLKKRGFRWAGSRGHWYGLREMLPKA